MSNETHKIGVWTATITGMNAMIGAGIFTAPVVLGTAKIGPSAILTYIFVVISVWFIAQSLARVAYRYPQEGSFYTYAKQWGGHFLGIIASVSYLIGAIMAIGLIAKIAGSYLHYIFPAISGNILGMLVLTTIIIINLFGAALSQLGQKILIICTVFPIIAAIIMCFSKADTTLLTSFAPKGIGGILQATRLAIFGFFGFESAASLFNIVKNPEKNVPKAITYSIVIVGILYILFVSSIVISVPLSWFSSPEIPLSAVLGKLFPTHRWLIIIIHLSILSAMIGTIHSLVWGTSHLTTAIFKKLKSNTAKVLLASGFSNLKSAVAVVGALSFTFFLTIKKIDLFFYFAAILIVFSYTTSIIPLLSIKEEWKSKQNIKTIIGIATAMIIFYFALEGIIKELI